MARKVTPNSWADTTAYIAEGSDAGGEGGQLTAPGTSARLLRQLRNH